MQMQTAILNRHRLRQVRERAGLSQAELARRSKLTPPGLNKIETGKRRIGPDALRRVVDALAVALDMPPDEVRGLITTDVDSAAA